MRSLFWRDHHGASGRLGLLDLANAGGDQQLADGFGGMATAPSPIGGAATAVFERSARR